MSWKLSRISCGKLRKELWLFTVGHRCRSRPSLIRTPCIHKTQWHIYYHISFWHYKCYCSYMKHSRCGQEIKYITIPGRKKSQRREKKQTCNTWGLSCNWQWASTVWLTCLANLMTRLLHTVSGMAELVHVCLRYWSYITVKLNLVQSKPAVHRDRCIHTVQ